MTVDVYEILHEERQILGEIGIIHAIVEQRSKF